MRQKIFQLAEQVAEEQGVELFGIELLGKGKVLLRVFIDKDGGVTLDDCQRFSKSLGIVLDVENPIPGSYKMEVSSPGLDRPLRNLKDYEKNTGKLARVITKEKIENRNFFIGRILGIHYGMIRLLVGEQEMNIPVDNISRASLEIEV
ncbi:MAG TPA: ribosome maturation factor RimP [Thermodesulfovibrionales bacterium]|jgi:ribosome maturation factor RimP|nr:ribosome maturation factor RimP [Thermodesulfovibrionales bacterium]